MKTVIIASDNPVKVEVAQRAFRAVFPDEQFNFVGIKSDSGVPDQPQGEQTRQGALHRLAFIQKHQPEADYWISQEGGIFEEQGQTYGSARMAVSDSSGFIGEASAASFTLPPKIVEYLNEGMELGHAIDKFFGDTNSKHGLGAIGHLTEGVINRVDYYLPAAIIAIYQVKNKQWYQ